MKTSSLTFVVVAAVLALAGLLAFALPFELGGLVSGLGYCTVVTVVALIAVDYRLSSRRPALVRK